MRRMPATAAILVTLGAAAPLSALELGGFTFSEDEGLHARYIGPVVPAWLKVDLRFVTGDHHIATMWAGPDGLEPNYLIGWADATRDNPFGDGGEDPIAGEVQWVDLGPNVVVRSVSSETCQGTCRLGIPRFLSGTHFALLGFQVSWNRDVDHHVRELAVAPDPFNGAVYFTFVDDAGTEPYTVQLAYAMVPGNAVRGTGSRASTTPATSSALATRPAGLAVLRGFRLEFTNSDHHLQRFAIDLTPASGIRLRWRDINGDDPFDWSVSYLLLNE